MHNNNTTSLLDFVRDCACWLMTLTLIYKVLIFKCIDGMFYNDSVRIFWNLIVASTVVCAFIVTRYNRNFLNVMVTVLLPLEIYTVIAYYPYFKSKILLITVITAVVLGVYGILMLIAMIRGGGGIKSVFPRLTRFVYCSRIISAVALAFFVAPMVNNIMNGVPLYDAKTEAVAASEENKYTIENHIDTVCMLDDEKWMALELEERIEVLQIIANIEANRLGVAREISVVANNLDEGVLGSYNDNTNTVTVDIEILRTAAPGRITETICHEVFHSYERRLVDIYRSLSEDEKRLAIFKDAGIYMSEFESYKTGGKEYFEQRVEADSRSYAEASVAWYMQKINEHLGGDGKREEIAD